LTQGKLRVVFDVNVFIDAIVGSDSNYPVLYEVPPESQNSAADCLSLAFDGKDFSLFVSPHILRNVNRILQDGFGLTKKLSGEILTTITEIVHFSGGSIVDPQRTNSELRDFEDNLILNLLKATESLVLVNNDREFLRQSPWFGRVLVSTRDFVARTLRAR
jgi:predicted nucleic acid-binding protein